MQITPTRTVVHLSDTHILPSSTDRLHGVDTLDNLQRVIQRLVDSEIKPDAIVVSGDLADHGEQGSYERLRPVLDDMRTRFGVPVLPAIGNHDARASFRAGLLGEDASEEPYYYVARAAGLRIVVLDSTVPGAPYGELDATQLDWLASTLAEPAPEGTLVVLHHPPIPGPVPVINHLLLRNADQLAEVIRDSDVLAVLAGHAHHPIAGSFADRLCFAAPACAYTVDALTPGMRIRGIEGAAFGLIHVYERTVVASAASLPSEQRELYDYAINDDVLRRWGALAEATAAVA